jgi:Ca2+-transporting ATPase
LLNLITDILPALGLALAEPRGDVMLRPPRLAKATLFDRREAAGIVLDGAGIGIAALVAHFTLLSRAGVGQRTRSATFLTLALAQIAHAWVLRDRSPVAGEALTISERRLEAMLAISGALLALPMIIPSLRRLIGIGPPMLRDLVLASGLAAASFGAAEGRRLIASASRTPELPRVLQPGQKA